jgi:hypothetical protein
MLEITGIFHRCKKNVEISWEKFVREVRGGGNDLRCTDWSEIASSASFLAAGAAAGL